MDSSLLTGLILLFGILITIGLFIAIALLLRRPKEHLSGELGALMERLAGLSAQNRDLRQTVDEKLRESHLTTARHFGEATKIIQDVTEKLTKLDETNRQVVNFSSQLQHLQEMLKNPKQRGVLGEYYLETLLKNVLPPGSYQMQYGLGDNTIVDAAVFVKDKVIPIDSKFSLENYNRLVETHEETERARLEKVFVNDLKNRIIETAKYIQPQKGTMDFAFMFIPHEAIYYDLIINKIGALTEETENLIQRAASKYKVIIVSPTSFLAYLQTVLQGLRALQIEESALVIRDNVQKLSQHLAVYDTYVQKMGASLTTTTNHFNNLSKEWRKIDKDVVKITGKEATVELLEVEKPNLED